jgi:hypothetical protein
MTINHNGSVPKQNGHAVPENNSPVDIGTAIRACNPGAVPNILKELSSFGSAPAVDDDDVRVALLASAKALTRALETPRETMIQHNWAQVC